MTALDKNAIIGVIGAGTMGTGIAQVAAAAGHSVLLYDAAENAAAAGFDKIEQGLQKRVEKNRIAVQEKESILGNISIVDSLDSLAPCSLIVEAIIENLKIKQTLFQQLERICSEQVIIGSNTSSLSLTSIGSVLQRPQNLVGMHFFNPAPVMKLVEVISSLATDKNVAESVYETALAWGKMPVFTRSTPGFIVNRVARPFYAESLRIVEEAAADTVTVDAIMRETGNFRMGPFELMDLIGQDVNYAVTCSVFEAYYGDSRFKPSLIQKELVDAGYLGRKSGRGFYIYSKDAEKPIVQTEPDYPLPDPIGLHGNGLFIEPMKALLRENNIGFKESNTDDNSIQAGAAWIKLSDGRSASRRAAEEDRHNIVLSDLAYDFTSCSRVALTAADQCSLQAKNDASGLFQALGKKVSYIDDIPGLCVLRTVCMLANEGADAVNQRVCQASAVDTAMQFGVNYPKGPLLWASDLGLAFVVEVLENLARHYGEDRYRVSPLLQRKAISGKSLYE